MKNSSKADYVRMRVHDFVALPAPRPAAVLLDRLWPRGISKENMAGVAWEKDATPSTELRMWFHADPDGRFDELQKRFAAELQAPAAQAALGRIAAQAQTAGAYMVLLTASKNLERCQLPVLQKALQQLAV